MLLRIQSSSVQHILEYLLFLQSVILKLLLICTFRDYVTSIYPLHLSCLSIWCLSDPCLPSEGQHDAHHGVCQQLFLQSNGSSQLVEQVFKGTGGHRQKCGASGLLPFFLTRIQIGEWASMLLHITDFGDSLFHQFWRDCNCELAIWLPSLQNVLCFGAPERNSLC